MQQQIEMVEKPAKNHFSISFFSLFLIVFVFSVAFGLWMLFHEKITKQFIKNEDIIDQKTLSLHRAKRSERLFADKGISLLLRYPSMISKLPMLTSQKKMIPSTQPLRKASKVGHLDKSLLRKPTTRALRKVSKVGHLDKSLLRKPSTRPFKTLILKHPVF